MKSNNITTDRTLNALRRHLSRTLVLLSFLILCVGQMWADPWVKNDVSTGLQGTKTVGDKLNGGSEWWYNYQTNGGWSSATDIQVLIGTSSSSYSTVNASWYADDGSNKKVHANIGSFTFDKSGIWYAVGKYYASSKTAYTSGTSFTNNSSLSSSMSTSNSPYWKVNPPAVSSFAVSTTGSNILSGTGTSEDPYIIAYNGSLALALSGSKAKTDNNSSLQYNTSGTWNTTTSRTISGITSAEKISVTVKMRCYNSTASLSGTESTKTIYYKAEELSYSLTVSKSTGISSVSGSNDDVTLGTKYAISATVSTGYSFSGWTADPSANGTFDNASSASTNVTVNNGSVTVTASATENKHNVTVYYKCGSTNIKTATTKSNVGEVNTSSVSAPSITGYTFSSWTAGSGVTTTTSTSSSPVSIKTKSSGTYSLTANYTENLNSTYYVEGDASGPFSQGWTANATTMMKKRTGSSTASDVYWTLEVPASKTAPGENQWEFKIYNSAGANDDAKYMGWGTGDNHYWVTKANNSLNLSTTGSNNMYFKCYVEGTYTFHLNYSTPSSPTLTITWPVVNQLRISAASPTDATNTNNFDLADQGSNNWAVTRTLNANTTYTFKMVYDGEWYGKNSTNLTRASNSANSLSSDGGDMTIRTDIAGSYTFTFNSSTKNLSVTYPTAYTITYNTNGATSGSAPEGSGTTYYAAGSNVTLATNTGILFKTGKAFSGWNTNAGGGTETHYESGGTLSGINANKTLYAEWKDNDYHMYFYNKDNWSSVHAHMWKHIAPSVNDPERSYPGRTMSAHQGKVYTIAYRSDVQDSVVFNNGNTGPGNQTGNIRIADSQSGDHWFYNDADKLVNNGGIHNGWSQYIMVADFPTSTVAAVVGEKVTITPVLAWAEDISSTDIEITSTRASGSSNVNAVISGSNIIVSGIAKGDAVFTITYHYVHPTTPAINYTITKTLNVSIKDGITIQSKVPKTDDHWVYSSCMKLHYWGTGVSDGDIDMTWVKEDASYTYYQTFVPLGSDSKINFLFYYDNFDDAWRKTQDITNVTASGCYTINHGSGLEAQRNAVRAGDQCVDTWQVQITMNNGDIFTSNAVENSTDVISFFAPSNASSDPSYRKGTVTLEHNGATAATLSSPGSPSATFSQSGVYTAQVNTSTPGLTNVALYTGNYYIRTDASHGGWDDYKTEPSNVMTHFNRNTNFPNETFSYYWVDNIAKSPGDPVNIKATVANDYNPVLCGFSADETVTREEYGINLRFGYEPTTNDLIRGILRGSNENNFLNVIDGGIGNVYRDAGLSYLMSEAQYSSNPQYSKMLDKSNWVYEINAYAEIDASHKAAEVYLKSVFNGTHYLLGMVKDEETGLETSTPIKLPIIATGSTYDTYSLRVVYDFKTNRLFGAWAPADITIPSNMTVDADVMFLRHEQGDVAQISFANTSVKVSKLNKAIFAVEIEDDRGASLGNRELHYFISLPFDCYVKDIFGIGGFMNYWGIQYYNGAERARIGWFIETPTFWEWLGENDMLEAGKGYLLSIDKKALQNDNVWKSVNFMDFVNGVWTDKGEQSILTLYFPSAGSGFSLESAGTSAQTITYPNQPCSITRDDRDQKDSNWKCIGTPGYKNMTMTGYTPTTPAPPVWDGNTPPKFLYEFTEQTTSATYAKGTYTAVNGSTFTYHAFHSYMVQYAGTINWGAYTMGNGPAAIAARRVQQSEMNQPTNVQIDLLSEDSTMLDRTFVWLREDATTAYDQNYDLNKMVESKANQIYSLSDRNVPFAANVLPYETDTVPLVVNIYNPGEYTFSLNKEEHFGLAPVLYDMYKSEQIDLLSSDYSVELTKGKYTDRFYLLFSPVRPIATDIETTEDGSQHVLSGEAIYDVLGRRVSTITPGHLYIVNGEKRIAQ